MAIFHCIKNLHNLNDVQSALMAARTRADVLRKEAEPYEQVSYRFFPTSKDVGNLAYSMQKKQDVHNDDWVNVNNGVEK